MSLSHYIQCLKKLKIDKAHGIAPHKPILILSIIQLIENGVIQSNKIYITSNLVAVFKSNWSLLVTTKHLPIFALPFYHLKSENFWKLHAKAGYEKTLELKGILRSFNNLNTAVEYAEIDTELFELLKNKENRDILRFVLLDKYFPGKNYDLTSGDSRNDYLKIISNEILEENPKDYRKKIGEFKQRMDSENYEEEIFLRGNTFKIEIPKIYNNTCCISKLRIDATISVSMIDACHIIPFSESNDDTISNGITLCPNLHRAFDRGLITIDNNYRVIVSRYFSESEMSPYQIKIFNGKEIILPNNPKYYPSLENFANHRAKFGF